MAVLLDVILILIFVVSITASYKKGLILNVYDMVSFIFVVAVAIILTTPFSEWFMTTPVYENTMKSAEEKIYSEFTVKNDDFDISAEISEGENKVYDILEKFNIDVESVSHELDRANESGRENAAKAFYDYVIVPLSKTLVKIIAFIILILAASVVSFVIRRLLKLISKVPVLKGANKTLGAVLGVFLGFLYCLLFSNLISIVIPGLIFLGVGIPDNLINDTYILKYICSVDFFSVIGF